MGGDRKKSYRDLGTYRFRSIATSRGYVSQEQVEKAFAEQEEDYITGRPHRSLGEILLDNYWITEEQMESVLKEIGETNK